MNDPEDNDDEALKALQEVRDELDGLRTRLKQVPHPATLTHPPAGGPAEPTRDGPPDDSLDTKR